MYIENIPEYNGAGIYMLKGINNELVYIGSSIHIAQRILQHENAMKCEGGSSNRMKSMIKPEYKFEVIVLEKISENRTTYYLLDRENYYMKKFNACGENGLNSRPVAGYDLDDCASGLQLDLKCLKGCIEQLERTTNDTIHNKKFVDYLTVCAESRVRLALENMLQKMKQIKDM